MLARLTRYDELARVFGLPDGAPKELKADVERLCRGIQLLKEAPDSTRQKLRAAFTTLHAKLTTGYLSRSGQLGCAWAPVASVLPRDSDSLRSSIK